jgi:hypothetical protein
MLSRRRSPEAIRFTCPASSGPRAAAMFLWHLRHIGGRFAGAAGTSKSALKIET